MMNEHTFTNINVNVDTLNGELDSNLNSYGGVAWNGANLRVFSDASRLEIQTVIDAHDPTVLTEDQRIEVAGEIALQDVRRVLARRLIDPNPDWLAIYNDARTYITQNPDLLQMIKNLVALEEIERGVTIDNSTTQGKAAWMQKMIEAIALLS